MASSPQFVNTPNLGLTKFVAADGTTIKTVFSPGVNGSRVMALVATSTDTAAVQLTVYMARGGVRFTLDTVALLGATAVTPTTNQTLLDPDWFRWLDQGEPHLILPADVTIQIGMVTVVSASKEVAVIAMGGDF